MFNAFVCIEYFICDIGSRLMIIKKIDKKNVLIGQLTALIGIF